jgi:Tfp pilus assembly protein PilZ
MLQKVLVISDEIDSCNGIVSSLQRDLPYQIFSNTDPQEIESMLESKVFHLVIIDHREVTNATMGLVNWLKHTHYSFPILVVSNTTPPEYANRLNLISDTHTLVRPLLEKSIVGLVRKLLVAKRVPKQLYRRFNTNQIAEVEALQSGDSLFTSMYNLSKGGAYCEFEGGQVLAVGDLIRMKVMLADTNHEYVFNAKVIWTTPQGRFSGRFGCGFRFVSQKDTYRSLLSKT